MIPTNLDQLQIIAYPDPVLKKRAAPVAQFGPELRALADRMLALMRQERGVGLAAPQVGVSIRMFVWNAGGETDRDHVFVNPVLSDLSGAEERDEGCLSLPSVNVVMRRATQVTVQAFDVDGKPIAMRSEGLIARIWQHETDHLDGRLIIDHMSEADELANRRLLKEMVSRYERVGKRGQARSRS